MTTSDKTLCFVRRNFKNGYHIQTVIKTEFGTQNGQKLKTRRRYQTVDENSTFNPLYRYACRRVSQNFSFYYIIVYNYRRTSKQKFPFQKRIPFYSSHVIFMYEYCTTSSYEITNESCSVIRSRRVPYNCPPYIYIYMYIYIYSSTYWRWGNLSNSRVS